MESGLHEIPKTDISKLKERLRDDDQANSLDIKQLERILKRLETFALSCSECEHHLSEIYRQLEPLQSKPGPFEKGELQVYKEQAGAIITHLHESHKLVSEDIYMNTGVGIGTAAGLILGLVFFGNMGVGLPVGLGVGLAVGMIMDAKARRKGLTV